MLFFTASDFTSITSHIHNLAFFSLWLHLFILSGVISPLLSSNILGTYWHGEFIFQSPIFLPFHTVQGFSSLEYWSGLPFPSPVDHVLSELSTMPRPSWVALHIMAHSFIELDKAVVHVISLVTFQRCLNGWRSLVGYSPWGCKESHTTEWLHFTSSFTEHGPTHQNKTQFNPQSVSPIRKLP